MGSRAGLLALVVVLAVVGGLAFWLLDDDQTVVETDNVSRPEERVDPVVPVPDNKKTELIAGDPDVVEAEPTQLDSTGLMIDPELIEGATAWGFVTFADGEPAADIDVQLYDHTGEYFDSSFTEEDGFYSVEAGEALGPGWSVMTESPDYDDGEKVYALGATYVRADKAHAPGDAALHIDLEILRAPRVTGRVLDALTGEAVDLAEITLVSTHSGWLDEWQSYFTDESGYYELSITNLPPEGVLVWCYGDFQQPGALGPLTLKPGQVYSHDFYLQPQRSLVGTVVDATTRQPIDGADITLIPLHPEFEDPDGWDQTGSDGSFELEPTETPFDMMTIYVQHDDYAPTVLTTPENGWPEEIEIAMGPARVLTGNIVGGEAREPVAGALVSVVLTTPTGLVLEEQMDEEMTNDDGVFELPLSYVPSNHGILTVHADGFYPFNVDLTSLTGDGDWTERDVTIALDVLVDEG